MEDNPFTKDEAKREAPAIVIAGTDLEHFTDEDWDIVTSKQEIVFARYVCDLFFPSNCWCICA